MDLTLFNPILLDKLKLIKNSLKNLTRFSIYYSSFSTYVYIL